MPKSKTKQIPIDIYDALILLARHDFDTESIAELARDIRELMRGYLLGKAT